MDLHEYDHITSNRAVRALCKAVVVVVEKSDNPNSITVQDVIDEADVSRSTFYNYFTDIYSLFNYIYYIDMKNALSECPNCTDDNRMIMILKVLQNRSVYYKKLCEITGHNSFSEYNRKFWYHLRKQAIIKNIGESAFTNKLDMALRMQVAGRSRCILMWIQNDCKSPSIEDVANILTNHMPDEFYCPVTVDAFKS